MNIFVIPSWYPNPRKPTSGIFVEEQAEAIAENHPEVSLYISTWGHSIGDLSIRAPFDMAKSLSWRARQKRHSYKNGGLTVVFNPVLNWSNRLPFGGIARLINANRCNFYDALSLCGKIDLIHAHACYPGGYIASVISKETGVPYVLTEHMGPFPFPNLMENGEPNAYVKQAINSAAAVIAVSPSLADRIASFGFQKPTFVPNLVNDRLFSILDRKSNDRFRFLTVGSVTHEKGIDILLKAIAMWKPDNINVEFFIAGNGEELRNYQSLASSLGIDSLIHWVGEVNRQSISRLFQGADAFVLPSRHETFGIVFCEAMATGIPVIATKCGGPELFVSENNGLLVNVDDTENLATALKYMYENASKYDPEDVRDSVVFSYSREKVSSQVVEIYSSVVNKSCAH